MARSRENMITGTYSGVVGPVVLTKDGNMRKRPDFSGRKLSPKQMDHLSRMEEAKRYGRMAVSDPEMNSWYASLAKTIEHRSRILNPARD